MRSRPMPEGCDRPASRSPCPARPLAGLCMSSRWQGEGRAGELRAIPCIDSAAREGFSRPGARIRGCFGGWGGARAWSPGCFALCFLGFSCVELEILWNFEKGGCGGMRVSVEDPSPKRRWLQTVADGSASD